MGGAHPALIEAMGQGNLIIANGTPENSEVLDTAGLTYRKSDIEDLKRYLQDVAFHPEKHSHLKSAALERARMLYSWDMVIDRYERLFKELTGHGS